MWPPKLMTFKIDPPDITALLGYSQTVPLCTFLEWSLRNTHYIQPLNEKQQVPLCFSCFQSIRKPSASLPNCFPANSHSAFLVLGRSQALAVPQACLSSCHPSHHSLSFKTSLFFQLCLSSLSYHNSVHIPPPPYSCFSCIPLWTSQCSSPLGVFHIVYPYRRCNTWEVNMLCVHMPKQTPLINHRTFLTINMIPEAISTPCFKQLLSIY